MKNKKIVATMTNNTKQSTVIDKTHYKNILIIMPTEWDAADISFLVSDNPTTGFVRLLSDAGAEIKLTGVAASTAIALTGVDKQALEPAMFIKLRSGLHGAEVAQTPGREFTIILS